MYQFWQTSRKKAVNESGDKIDRRTISSVTQLFTEGYMVQFLLHNTLGAWWAGKQFSIFDCRFAIEEEARAAVAVPGVPWEYLRFVPGESNQAADQSQIKNQKSKIAWTPAAGKFAGWPKTLKELTLLDPCCGSGHFLVAAFNLLVPLRMHEEGLSARGVRCRVAGELVWFGTRPALYADRRVRLGRRGVEVSGFGVRRFIAAFPFRRCSPLSGC